MTIVYQDDLVGIDWQELKAALAKDQFDNGRTPEQLKRSFQNSHGVCIAWFNRQVVGTARVLSDGVCNAYLIDVWTLSSFRLQGIAKQMVNHLCMGLTGQHVYLQVNSGFAEFYRRLGFAEQPHGMSRVIGRWLVNDPHQEG